jgi:hypothetical protein
MEKAPEGNENASGRCYLSHTKPVVQLYLQETFVFRVLTSEASVARSPSPIKSDKSVSQD